MSLKKRCPAPTALMKTKATAPLRWGSAFTQNNPWPKFWSGKNRSIALKLMAFPWLSALLRAAEPAREDEEQPWAGPAAEEGNVVGAQLAQGAGKPFPAQFQHVQGPEGRKAIPCSAPTCSGTRKAIPCLASTCSGTRGQESHSLLSSNASRQHQIRKQLVCSHLLTFKLSANCWHKPSIFLLTSR